MQIGDIVHVHPTQSPPGVYHHGTVEYIHPQELFYSVRFAFRRLDGKVQSYRESFYFSDRAGDPDYRGAATPEQKKERQGRHYKKKGK